VSSDYHLICLSHDPAIVLYRRDLTHAEAESVASREHPALEGHEDCDVVIGRYSAPLVEVACLGRQLPGPSGCKGHHMRPEWIDRDWLRLLAAAASKVDEETLRPFVTRCWPLERLRRLGDEAGLAEITAVADSPEAPPVTINVHVGGYVGDSKRLAAEIYRVVQAEALRRPPGFPDL